MLGSSSLRTLLSHRRHSITYFGVSNNTKCIAIFRKFPQTYCMKFGLEIHHCPCQITKWSMCFFSILASSLERRFNICIARMWFTAIWSRDPNGACGLWVLVVLVVVVVVGLKEFYIVILRSLSFFQCISGRDIDVTLFPTCFAFVTRLSPCAMLIVLSHLHVGSTSGNILISRYIECLLDIHQGIMSSSAFSHPTWASCPRSQNVFLSQEGHVRLGDFGLCRQGSQSWFLGQRFVRAWMMYQNDPKIMALLEYDPNYCFDRRYIKWLFQPFSMICKRDKIDIHPARCDPGTPTIQLHLEELWGRERWKWVRTSVGLIMGI